MPNTSKTQNQNQPRSLGSVWRKWDFHVHTPSSFDYDNKSVSDADLINAFISYGIAAVVLCDHHRIDLTRIESLKKLADGKVTIFPAIELRTPLGGKQHVHMVGIFGENADLSHIWPSLQGKLELTEARVKKEGDDRVYVEFKDAAQVIHELGGLISVHAGSKNNTLENIDNADLFKQAAKEYMALNLIDIYEIGRLQDVAGYEQKVFPEIGKRLPMVIGSDNHNIHKYEHKASTWIKSDPTLEGLRQILVEPRDRVYLGDMPPLLQRVSQNKTKYINKVNISKETGSTFGENWFDCSICCRSCKNVFL